MRKYLLLILILLWLIVLFPRLNKNFCPFRPKAKTQNLTNLQKTAEKKNAPLAEAFILLKAREDKEAKAFFEQILFAQPENQNALWGKAELLRRIRKYEESETILADILKKNPQYAPALTSLAYIRYKDGGLGAALKLVNQALKVPRADRESQAIAYMMLGAINSKRSSSGGLWNKIFYGVQIKSYFLKAKEIAPELPEVHLGLGTFYLQAPQIVGGDLDQAIEELELAVKLTPNFATPHARLAQAYQKKGDLVNYKLHLERAKASDPENEVLKELQGK